MTLVSKLVRVLELKLISFVIYPPMAAMKFSSI